MAARLRGGDEASWEAAVLVSERGRGWEASREWGSSRSLSLWAPPQIAPNSPNKHLFGGDSFLGGLDANNPNLTGYFRAI